MQKTHIISFKDQLNTSLKAFGLQVPENFPLDSWAARLGDSPCRNTVGLVAISSLLFYAAERGYNPKVNDIYDASIYCSTCLSVGYGDIFAKTPLGKIIGTALMTLGPAMANSALDGPAAGRSDAKQAQNNATQEQILATLKQILEKLPGAQTIDDAKGSDSA